jgi:imidazolonepropionase-like amidohydrolase
VDPEPERIVQKRQSFKDALESGVTLCFGGDVGVYSHGDNVRELEMMVEYGMNTPDALRAATSTNAKIFHLENQLGRLQAGLLADIISVQGNPMEQISDLRKITLVMKNGDLYLEPDH